MITRTATATLQELSRGYPIVSITGPRQSGKTTLARAAFGHLRYVSLEDPDERTLAESDPRRFLSRFPDGAVLDEVQKCPDLFSYLQTRVDEDHRMGLFVLTGSQQFGLLSGITQSLAGRVGLVQLLPFSAQELRRADKLPTALDALLFQGTYPPLYDRPLTPTGWFANYVTTYIERDVRQVAAIRDLSLFQRFLRLCAARTGQMLNLSSLADDCGISHTTVRQWISVLEATYIVFLLRPHFTNFGKRLVKTPKLYFFDSGLAAYLMGIHDQEQLAIHAARGALFETFVVSELLKSRYNMGRPSDLYFWRDSSGHEVDVIIEQGGLLHPVEIKSGQTLASNSTDGIKRWLALAGKESGRPLITYGGNENLALSEAEVLSWRWAGENQTL